MVDLFCYAAFIPARLCRTRFSAEKWIKSDNFYEDSEIKNLIAFENLFTLATDTDKKIIRLLCSGYSYEQISHQLFMSVNGIKYRLNKLLESCHISGRKELMEIYQMYFKNIISNDNA